MAKKVKKKKIKKSVESSVPRKTKKVTETKPIGVQQFPKIWSMPIYLAGFMLFALGLYFMTFNYGFILDDQVFYSKNNYVKEGISGIGKIFNTEAMAGYFGEQKDLITGARYRPLSMVTFALEHQFFGLKPGLSHVINAILYGLTGILLFYVSRLFWPKDDERPWYLKVGFWAALIFLAHPIHTEVVANIKGRDEIMALLFSLWTLIVAFKARKNLDYVWVALLFYLALLSKENALTFLAVIPASLYVFRKFHISRDQWIKLFTALIVAIVIYLIQRRMVIGYFLSSGKEITELLNNPFVDMNGSEKYATIFYTLLKYIQLLVWPHPLSHDYYPYAISTKNWSNLASIFALLLYMVMAVFVALKLKGRNRIAYFIFVFIATLSIVSNIPFTVGTTMNERFIYMSSIAFVWLVPYLFILGIKSNRKLWQKIGLILMTIMVVGFSFLTIRRIPVWENSIALNRSAVSAYPNSARSNLFMGTALFKEADATADFEEKRKLFEESRAFVEKSLQIHPIYGNGLKMKAGIAAKLYQMDNDMDKLFHTFTEVVRVKPGTLYVHQYIEYMIKSGRSKEALIDKLYELGYIEFAQNQGRYPWAEKFLKYAYQVDPNNRRVLSALVSVYENLNMKKEANDMRARLNQ